MTLQVGESKEGAALGAVVELARDSVQPATAAQLGDGWRSVSARLAEHRSRRKLVARWSLVAASACVAVALVAASISRLRFHSSPPPALAYQIEGGRVSDGGYLHETGGAGMKLLFTEGTEFMLAPGTRGRLRTVDNLGARISIEQGMASFQVTPGPEARWLVDVGPFLVKVKGTVFTVSWNAGTERFELRLRHGRVSVSGPMSGGEIELRAGQRLVVDLPKAETFITEQKPDDVWTDLGAVDSVPAAGDSAHGTPLTTPERPAVRSPASLSPTVPTRLDGERRWAEAVAAGKWDRILADAERAGVRSTLANATSEELFALADAARYRSRTNLAREALLAERRRFPTSVRALDATFLLGRIEESSEPSASKALRWYDEYLARAPTGTYASEALGRKMIAISRNEGAARARPLAEEYLRRFPTGTYAGSARALRRGP